MAQTARNRGITPEVIEAEAKARVPLGEMPQPADIAAAVAFLCSPDARFITGSELIVDGGLVHCDTFEPAR